nr:AAA family ATPase [Neobacillus sp. Marseille-Q6967]
MGEKVKAEQKREILFTYLESHMGDNVFLYFKKNKNLKFQTRIIDKVPKVFLDKDQIKYFGDFDYTEKINRLRDNREKNYFKNKYNELKKLIKSNVGIDLQTIIIGYLGLYTSNRETVRYNAHDNMSFSVAELNNISEELSKGLQDFNNEFITINELANKFYSNDDEDEQTDENDSDESDTETNTDISLNDSRNVIFFGPPGTGKSYKIKANAKNIQVNEKDIIRVTFHPEYSYYDFVGQYKPVVGYELLKDISIEDFFGNIIEKKPFVYYGFVPGPFTKAIIKALSKKDNVLLVIEEINRGNCAAIFGDIFQLLDRVADISSNNYGDSEYQIDIPIEMKEYIKHMVNWSEQNWNERFPQGFFIPSNLFLYATMNTSDQSLFPMDSAFKRRWSMEYININYEQQELHNMALPSPYNNIKWLDFIKVINKKIVTFTESDDKQIGQWFVEGIDDEITEREFRGKLISYLWFDVFRHEPSWIFRDEIKTYDDFRLYFEKGIFNEEIQKELEKDE